MDNIQKDSVPKTKKYRRFYCALCDTYTNSVNQLNQHLEGIRHKQKAITNNAPKKLTTNGEDHQFNSQVYLSAFIVVIITTYVFCYVIVNFCNWYLEQLIIISIKSILRHLKFRAIILIGGEVVPKRSRLLCARTNAQNNEVAAILCRCLRKT